MAQRSDKAEFALEPYQIVLRPLVTEKGLHKAERCNAYAFEVNPLAGKKAIREAIEYLFDVKVARVNTQTRRGKPRRSRLSWGTTKTWKKAIVTLDPEDRLNFF